MNVFDVFDLSGYTFLEISRGGVMGNRITSQTNAEGVFKLRNGSILNANQEEVQSSATLHVKPSEAFVSSLNDYLIGHGIRKGNQDYEIVGQTGGDNFDTGEREHYRLTLQRANFSDYEVA